VFQFAPAIRCAPCSGRAVIVTMPPRVPPALSVRNGPRELVIQGSSGGSGIAEIEADRVAPATLGEVRAPGGVSRATGVVRARRNLPPNRCGRHVKVFLRGNKVSA